MSRGYVAIAPALDWREIDGSVLVLHEEVLHKLTGSSAEIWQTIDGSMSVEELASVLSQRHPESSRVADDVVNFVTEMTERGLLLQRPDPVGNGYRVPEYVAWTSDNDGSVTIADLRTGARHSLTPTGGLIWAMTATGSPVEVLDQTVRDAFADAPESYAKDIGRLLDSLVAAGLLERSPFARRPASFG